MSEAPFKPIDAETFQQCIEMAENEAVVFRRRYARKLIAEVVRLNEENSKLRADLAECFTLYQRLNNAAEVELVEEEAQASALNTYCERLADEVGRLRAIERDYEEREDAVCPEDVPFDEYIRALHAEMEKPMSEEKPWGYCPWCGRSMSFHDGDPTMTCGIYKSALEPKP